MAISEELERKSKNKAKLAKIRNASKESGTVNTSKLGLAEGWSRTTLAVRDIHINKLKDLARLERTTIKVQLDRILEQALSSLNTDSIFNDWKKMTNDKKP